MRVILFDENGPYDLGNLDLPELHNTIASTLGEPTMPSPQSRIVESKSAANYTPTHGSSTEWCAICQFWTMGPLSNNYGLCHVVAGDIDPAGWCRHFQHCSEAAE